MKEIKLKIIPRPSEGTRRVMNPEVTPAFMGDGDNNYVCGQCGTILAESIRSEYVGIKNIVVCCPKCGEYNGFP